MGVTKVCMMCSKMYKKAKIQKVDHIMDEPFNYASIITLNTRQYQIKYSPAWHIRSPLAVDSGRWRTEGALMGLERGLG